MAVAAELVARRQGAITAENFENTIQDPCSEVKFQFQQPI